MASREIGASWDDADRDGRCPLLDRITDPNYCSLKEPIPT
ncbi:hypothetical protein Pan14r_47020 [Crateriforma conspicua]|uniref:Uncharacterized protein n=1 Tax=Crateriforma conspicua TaxID=2527996 RepID=A0A5C5YGM7_9PLAN|nr:hypothetical protein Mal65_04880 [Crateriforma conspicua]TWT72382.1 hypothetical protein Pan14r_47020 [Crateriforma conspicua]